jgi:hypothetical protein
MQRFDVKVEAHRRVFLGTPIFLLHVSKPKQRTYSTSTDSNKLQLHPAVTSPYSPVSIIMPAIESVVSTGQSLLVLQVVWLREQACHTITFAKANKGILCLLCNGTRSNPLFLLDDSCIRTHNARACNDTQNCI